MMKYLRLFVLIFASGCFFGKPHLAQASEPCARALKHLAELKDVALEENRGELFTVALESSLFVTKPFISFSKNAIQSTKDNPSDITHFQAGIDSLMATYKSYEEYPSLRKQAKVYKVQAKELKRQRADTIKRNKEISSSPAPDFASLTPQIREQIATTVWNDLASFYDVKMDSAQIDFRRTGELTEKAKLWDLNYSQFIELHEIVKEVSKDEKLKTAFINLISELMVTVQKDESAFKNQASLLGKFRAQGSLNGLGSSFPLRIRITDFEDLNVTTLVKLVPEGSDQSTLYISHLSDLFEKSYPILFSESYFKVFTKVAERAGLKPEDLVESIENYSPKTKREFSEAIWADIQSFYQVSKIESQNHRDGASFAEKALEEGIPADQYISRAYLLKAVESRPDIREKVIEMIQGRLTESAQVTPHVATSEKWKFKNIGSKATALASSAAAVAGAIGTFYVTDKLHISMPETFDAAIPIIATTSAASVGATLAAKKGFDKVRDFWNRRKAKQTAQEVKTDTPKSKNILTPIISGAGSFLGLMTPAFLASHQMLPVLDHAGPVLGPTILMATSAAGAGTAVLAQKGYYKAREYLSRRKLSKASSQVKAAPKADHSSE